MFGFSDRVQLFAGSFASQAVRIGSGMVLARFLTESDYGRYAYIISATGLVSAIGDLGTYRVITSRKDLPIRETVDAATTITIAVYALNAVIAVAAGFFFARAHQDQRLVWVGLIQATTVAASGYYGLQVAIMARQLQFSRWAALETGMAVLTSLTGVALAVGGAGMFALAVPPCVAQLAAASFAPRSGAIRWPRKVQWPLVREFAHFGWQASVFQYVNNVQANIVNLMIGGITPRWADGSVGRDVTLGRYNRATQARNMFGHNLALALDRVLYPILCRDQDDREAYARTFIRGTKYLFIMSGFGAAGLIALAPDLVRVMLGSKWQPVTPILQVVCTDLFATAFGVMSISVAMIDRRPLVACGFALLQLALLLPAAWVYTAFGTLEFCAVLAASSALVSTAFYGWTCRQHAIPRRPLFAGLARLTVVIVASGLAMALARDTMVSWLGNPSTLTFTVLRLAVCGGLGTALAAAGLYVADRETYREMLQLLARRRRVAVPAESAP